MKRVPRQGYDMECDKCDHEAVMHAAYSGSYLCDSHFRVSVESRVRGRIREDELVTGASPDDPERWVIGLSGGKDSVVLTHILHDTFRDDPRIELVALTIHEGIEGYRDQSVDACNTLVDQIGVDHVTINYEDEYQIQMDDVAVKDPLNMAPCAYCGVFRRDILDRHAAELNADILFTGHNLDDEAQTALMNFLEGDVGQIAKHYDASLAPMSDRSEADFIPRAKPLRDIPEKEVALYAHVLELPTHMAECPHASEAYRGEIQDLLLELESHHPGTRHSIVAGYEKLAPLVADAFGQNEEQTQQCEQCGSVTTQRVCRKCRLLEVLTE